MNIACILSSRRASVQHDVYKMWPALFVKYNCSNVALQSEIWIGINFFSLWGLLMHAGKKKLLCIIGNYLLGVLSNSVNIYFNENVLVDPTIHELPIKCLIDI